MTNDKTEANDVTIYAETPATGINNGIEITPSAKQEEKIEKEATETIREDKQQEEQDAKQNKDTSGEAG